MEFSTDDLPLLLGSNETNVVGNITDTENTHNNTDFLFNNITAKPLYQTVVPNYAQQVLYTVQTLHLPTLPVDTAYIGKYN